MNNYLFILFLLSSTAVAQQNLVPNGSFEDYSSCPTTANNNLEDITVCDHWFTATQGTCDYFNGCSPDLYLTNVPVNALGYQHAYVSFPKNWTV